MNIKKIKLNPKNPRQIKDNNYKKLVKSIKEFPEMLKLKPIVIDENNMVLGGNMRLRACRELGLEDIPVNVAKGLTDEQKKEFIVKDNIAFGEWNWDTLLSEWNTEKLDDWGVDLPTNTTDFQPVGFDEQGQLDKFEDFICPECAYKGSKKDFTA